MKARIVQLAAGGALAALATGAAHASVLDVNGMFVNERVFNDFPDSTLTVTNNFPSEVILDDRDATGTGFANRHDAVASTDGGSTAATFGLGDGFRISADVTLDVSDLEPRKEAGLRVNSPVTGDALFIVNSDAGEIVAFGGGAPFHSFGSLGTGDGYTAGESLFMEMVYRPGNGDPGTVEYRIDRGAGIESSGQLNWDNLEGGPVSYQLAFYVQGSVQDASMTGTFANIQIVPEPGTALLLGAAALVGLVRPHRRGVSPSAL